MRKDILCNGEYYHIFNRGTDKREIFSDVPDYERFLLSMDLLNDVEDGIMIKWRDYKKSNPFSNLDEFLKLRFRKREPMVEIVAYCLNPNHFHFILKQTKDKGIEKFMQRIGVSHTKYYNKKHRRSGSLFQGVFKSILVDSNEYLLYLSAYVNKNNFIHGYSSDNSWPYSSLQDYFRDDSNSIVCKNVITDQFKNIEEYKDFLEDNASYLKNKKELAKLIIEE